MTMPIVELNKLTRKFGRGPKQITAVDELSLAIPPHQVYGLLGQNGAGKSTTLRMLLGLIHPTSGDINVFGQPLARAGDRCALDGLSGLIGFSRI
jgi:ABC-type multidrug transport system ATPase subunit